MNPFLNLPDEILLEICNNMSFSDLNKFVQTNKRNYNTCKEIFNKRILEIINKGNTIIFELTTVPDTNSTILLYEEKDEGILEEVEEKILFLRQVDYIFNEKIYPWILGDFPYEYDGEEDFDEFDNRELLTSDAHLPKTLGVISQILLRLYNYGYKFKEIFRGANVCV